MKFAKRLEAEAVAEWRPKYLQYKQLKKLIKIIAAQRQVELRASGLNKLTDLERQSDAPFSSDELLFFERFDAEVKKIDDFYRAREQEAVERRLRIMAQLQILPTTIPKQEPGDNRTALSPASEKTELSYNTHVLYSPEMSADHASILTQNQLSINSGQYLEATNHHLKISSLRSLSFTRLAKRRIKKALLEFYRSLELLRNFKTLNYLGCVKIMKKFDKNAGRSLEGKTVALVRENAFCQSPITDNLLTDVENIYRWVFTEGDRSRALRKLRVKDLKSKTYHREAYWSGLSLGICLLVLYYLFRHVLSASLDLQVLGTMYFYLGLPLMLSWLFAINAEVWDKYGINYRFIFELNQRNHLHVCQYSAMVGMLCICYLMLVAISLSGALDGLLRPLHQPWIVLVSLACVLLWPFNHFYRQSRTWFARVVLRIATAPFYPCRFKDFFINDQYMSLVPTFEAFGLLIYYSTTNQLNPAPPAVWYVYALQLLPGLWRSLQCLRRFHDSKMLFPHLVNLAKYSSFLAVVSCLAVYRLTSGNWSALFWTLFSMRCVSSTFSLGWDILMDFGLWHRSAANDRLRDTIIFPPWVYWYLILSNVVARFVWIVGFVDILPSVVPLALIPMLVALIEVLRRFQWNFFRVEYEHVNNCNVFRAVTDVALPYTATDLFYQDMVEITEKEREETSDPRFTESPQQLSKVDATSSCTSGEDDLEHEAYEASLDYSQDLEDVQKTVLTEEPSQRS